MLGSQTSSRSLYNDKARIELNTLGRALHHCFDLTFLQNSDLTQLPSVVRKWSGERHGLDLAKALRRELIDAAEQITRRADHHAIRDIVDAIEEERLNSGNQRVAEIQKHLGIPFTRDKIDLARYYAIRLVMEGLSNEIVADFLQVEMRTFSNYVAEAKERIRLTLESR